MEYIENIQIYQTLDLLGITKGMLFFFTLGLVVLLLFLFAFIFTGMSAFSMGGGLSSIINSIFPVLGGGAVGNVDSNKEKQANVLNNEVL